MLSICKICGQGEICSFYAGLTVCDSCRHNLECDHKDSYEDLETHVTREGE